MCPISVAAHRGGDRPDRPMADAPRAPSPSDCGRSRLWTRERRGHARSQFNCAVTGPGMANERIARFTRWANTLADVHGRGHETIPDDHAGAVTMRRLRRNVAWFINRQPGG